MPDQNQNKSSDYLYLEKLKFDPKLRKTWLNFFVTRFRVVALLIVLITGWGLYSYFQLPRESNPEVKIPIAIVSTTYPGASPSDIEELVTKKLETGISGLKNLKMITSSSANSFSLISVEFEASADLNDSIRSLRDEVTSLKPNLPNDANDPVVTAISFDDTPFLTFSLTGPIDSFSLRRIADDLKDELEKLPDIREVTISGGDEKEFEIAYDPLLLAYFNISADQANQAVKSTNLAFPAGSFEGKEYTYPVRADGRFFSVEKLRNVPVFHSSNGAIVYLKDLAQVNEKAITRTVYSRFSNGGSVPQDSITVSVVKKTGGNIIKTVDQIKTALDAYLKKQPAGIRYAFITNLADQINTQFDQLTHDFLLTVIMVFAILLMMVGLKEALVAGLAVPLVFFVTFGVMNMTGITLNFLSIFSLILSLGLLVDDAIVVVSATKQYMASGKFTPEEAVLLVLNDFKVVLTTTTLTTVWAFLPLLMATGIIGSFIKSIPITVSVTLISSLLIALMINHPLAAVLERIRLTRALFFPLLLLLFGVGLLSTFSGSVWGYLAALTILSLLLALLRWYIKKGRIALLANAELMEREWQSDDLIKEKLKHQATAETSRLSRMIHGLVSVNYILPLYDRILCKIITTKKLKRSVIALTAILFIVAVALPATGVVPIEFFPASDQDTIFVNARAATGLNLDGTDRIIRLAEAKLVKYPDIKSFSSVIGRSGSNGSSLSATSNSSNLASLTINLIDKKKRSAKSYVLAETIRHDLAEIKEASFTVQSQSSGPPSGSAFEARIVGDDLQELDKIAQDLRPLLSSIQGVADTDISLKDSPAEYTFELIPDRLELYNLNAAYVGSMLRMAISGTEVSSIIENGKETKINARFDKSKLNSLTAVQNLQILNLQKQPVFLKDIAKIELIPSVESISRIDQKRVVLLSAGVSGTTRPNAVLAEFQNKLAQSYKLPAGYSIIYGGENEQNAESVQSIITAMLLAGILIIVTLIIQFNSIKKSFIVLATIPLALIGVFFGMAIARINLSFPGLIGILALFGIVVKNAIILMDKINLNIRSGIPFEDSIVDAGKSRLEAIFITSISTIAGILPITLSNETWRSLGGAIIFGLMLSSFLTLFIIPILYSMLVKKEGVTPTTRLVETDNEA